MNEQSAANKRADSPLETRSLSAVFHFPACRVIGGSSNHVFYAECLVYRESTFCPGVQGPPSGLSACARPTLYRPPTKTAKAVFPT